MLFQRITTRGLAHAANRIGDQGEAEVVDPRSDIDEQLRARGAKVVRDPRQPFSHGDICLDDGREPTIALSERLSRLVRDLSRFERELDLEALTAAVERSKIQRADVAPYLSLKAEGYCHRHVYRSSVLEIGCIGWRPKQHTPVHHHAGSACCVLVLDGVLTNVDFASAQAPLIPRERTLRAGETLAYRGHELHRMSNDTDGVDLFTLHVYSPPLAPMSHRVSR